MDCRNRKKGRGEKEYWLVRTNLGNFCVVCTIEFVQYLLDKEVNRRYNKYRKFEGGTWHVRFERCLYQSL